jgi:hypothetical protein
MYLVVEVPQPPPQIGKFRCSDEIVVKILNHYAGKFDVLVFREAIGHGAIYPFRAQCKT